MVIFLILEWLAILIKEISLSHSHILTGFISRHVELLLFCSSYNQQRVCYFLQVKVPFTHLPQKSLTQEAAEVARQTAEGKARALFHLLFHLLRFKAVSWHPAGDRLPDKTAETVDITSRIRPPTPSHQLRGSPGQLLIPCQSSLRPELDSSPDNSLELREFRNLPAADHHHRVRGDLGVH